MNFVSMLMAQETQNDNVKRRFEDNNAKFGSN